MVESPPRTSLPLPNRPVIAVTVNFEEDGRLFTDLISRCGGDPLLITSDSIAEHEQLAQVGGMLLGNGPTELSNGSARVLNDTMTRLLPTILDFDLPLIAVGGGMHSLNMAMGGGEPQKVHDHDSDGDKSTFHHIYVAPGCKLAAIVGAGGFVRVNSRHGIGIKEPQRSADLMAAAYSVEDGVIEAIESPGHSLVVGVQFQPERPREVPPHFDNLFHLLVERAGR